MNKYTLIILYILCLCFIGCDQETAVNVVNPFQQEFDDNWLSKFGDIDSTQNWSLVKNVDASISIHNGDALSDYYLQLYTDNPIYNGSSSLIASKKVTTNIDGTAVTNFNSIDIISGHTVFYACYVDRYYRKYVKPVALVNNEINAEFGINNTRAIHKSESAADIPSVNTPVELLNDYSKAIELTQSNYKEDDVNNANFAKVFKISAGNTWSGKIPSLASKDELARTLYVEGTWDLGNNNQNIGKGAIVIVKEGGKIIIPKNTKLGSTEGARIIIFKGGKIEGDGTLVFCSGTNNENFDYNAGQIDIAYMDNNMGYFYNYGTINIRKELQGTSDNSLCINHSSMKVKTVGELGNTHNMLLYNACNLDIENNLCCKEIRMGNTSYTHVGKDLKMASGTLYMSANSYLAVDGGIALNFGNIVGPTSGWAICEFDHIGCNVIETNYELDWSTGTPTVSKGYVINNLYISIEQTEESINYWNPSAYGKFITAMLNGRAFSAQQIHASEGDYNPYPVYYGTQVGNGNAVIVKKGETNLSIPVSDCGYTGSSNDETVQFPGYNNHPGTNEPTTPQSFIIACEDLGSTCDIDFNDIVFGVSHVNGENFIKITPLAAGGTLPAYILYDGINYGEIHSLFGEENTSVIINTRNGMEYIAGIDIIIDVDEDWSFADNVDKFSIIVQKSDNISQHIYSPTIGTAPFMIVVPSTWQWPLENMNISRAYPGFINWSQNAAVNDEWISSRANGMTYNR